jgi:preprotein translocase subunit SecA
MSDTISRAVSAQPAPIVQDAADAACGCGHDHDHHHHGHDHHEPVQTLRRAGPKIGRNDPCPCGSGKKHKKCCGA